MKSGACLVALISMRSRVGVCLDLSCSAEWDWGFLLVEEPDGGGSLASSSMADNMSEPVDCAGKSRGATSMARRVSGDGDHRSKDLLRRRLRSFSGVGGFCAVISIAM